MPLVELQGVNKRYQFGRLTVKALQDVGLEIEKGEFVALSGPSGSGKSTLCHILGALDRADSGQVLLNGIDMAALDDDAKADFRNQSIGFVFQQFNLVPVLSALENVLLPLQFGATVGRDSQQKAWKLLESMGLADHSSHRPDKLSGGQQQRVAIARALVTDPAIVIADEPTANLDSTNAQLIVDTLRTLNRESGTTVVFSSHDMGLVKQADRAIHLADGRIAPS
ncbi:hypothetical protein DDZ13_00745 [Coraliomargarita sinensis]|uniref:ABC transporter domain-containing protein n=1 Tax=Coraliomargarita sinensis TaxID=2174842 RepID=A0A317ZNH7_9BACT|nr:ABC transporter ATP-binding protein [Coraliomargarita sinensis]PXA05428.1 hypothetical protein DDZ13_00745 [Coraliomargarita sinensis]